jgi:hypothetical protein
MNWLWIIVGAVILVFILKMFIKTLKVALFLAIIGGVAVLWWALQSGMFK